MQFFILLAVLLASEISQMGDRQTYEEVKKLLAEIQNELATQSLNPDQRAELERHASALSGQLLRPWLPIDWTRRLIFAAIVLLAIQQAFVGNYQVFFWWIFLPFFSPRITGECAFIFGRLASFFKSA